MLIFTISDIIGIIALAVCVVIIIGFFIAGGIVTVWKKFSEKLHNMRGKKNGIFKI